MALDEDLIERVRAVPAGTGSVREVRMFGGLCFMLKGNVVAGTSKRGPVVRVGREQQPMRWCGRAQSLWRCRGGRWRATSSSIPRDERGLRVASSSLLPS